MAELERLHGAAGAPGRAGTAHPAKQSCRCRLLCSVLRLSVPLQPATSSIPADTSTPTHSLQGRGPRARTCLLRTTPSCWTPTAWPRARTCSAAECCRVREWGVEGGAAGWDGPLGGWLLAAAVGQYWVGGQQQVWREGLATARRVMACDGPPAMLPSPTEAVLALEAECQRNPSNAEAWRLLGTVQAENDDDQQAIAAMNRCTW